MIVIYILYLYYNINIKYYIIGCMIIIKNIQEVKHDFIYINLDGKEKIFDTMKMEKTSVIIMMFLSLQLTI